MANEVPQSINLLTPVNTPEDSWERLYEWLFSFGKYILIAVLGIVLVVFGFRFAFDRINNDLTGEVNTMSATLADDFFRNNEIKYNNWHRLLSDMNRISAEQQKNSTVVASITESVPSDVELVDMSYVGGRVSMNFIANDFQAVQGYESLLKKNPNYDQSSLKVLLNKSGSSSNKIEFSVGFNINQEEAAESAAAASDTSAPSEASN
ncbi:MAG: hypothetical protein QY318_02010 [Candidatus Dojkabacteria bacterium]|nr:MAG: hypothetical protein QY318_02010 [Candidatus Dojkabacteria bacterium]